MSEEAKVEIPKFGSREWHDYVMSKFEADELFEGNPKVEGLWRVTEEVLGIIGNYDATVTQSAHENNAYTSTVQCNIVVRLHQNIRDAHNKDNIYMPDQLTTAGVGDCGLKNADRLYAIFPSSLAETRAKGRALRTLLRLRNVVAAEELHSDAPDETDEFMSDDQLEKIETLCEKMNINTAYLIRLICEENQFKLESLRRIRKHIAAKVIKRISTFQTDKSLLTKEFKGFVKEWKSSTKG